MCRLWIHSYTEILADTILTFVARFTNLEKTFQQYHAFFQEIDKRDLDFGIKANLAKLLLNCTCNGKDNLENLSITTGLLSRLSAEDLTNGFVDYLSKLNALLSLQGKQNLSNYNCVLMIV